MAGPRQMTDVVKANGKKHLSKAEEAARRAREVKLPAPAKLKVPGWLPEYLKPEFKQLAKLLLDSKMGVAQLDADTIGRYLVAQRQYAAASIKTQEYLDQEDAESAAAWSKLQEKYFTQARSCANDMGMTITSRCKLVLPEGAKQEAEQNPFLHVIQFPGAVNG